MSYGRIRRGPMAADAFTQIRNSFFRDPRLTMKDKGLFGLISTHRDGWGVTPESLAACCADGVSAVKVALRNLEKHGYLRRTRQRNADGTLGASVYFITDQPEAFGDAPELETPRSAPEVENPPVDNPPMVSPPVAEPPVANRPHKKTNSKKINLQEDSLSSSASPAAEPPPAPVEREINAAPDKPTTAQRVVRASGAVAAEEESAFIAWATAKFSIQGPGWWKACAGDLPEHATAWRASLTASSAAPLLAEWCGECEGPEVQKRWVYVLDAVGHERSARCARCNPHHPGARGQPGAA